MKIVKPKGVATTTFFNPEDGHGLRFGIHVTTPLKEDGLTPEIPNLTWYDVAEDIQKALEDAGMWDQSKVDEQNKLYVKRRLGI